MAKREKIPLTPEMKAAKSLRRRKGRARFLAVLCAVAITAVVFVTGSKDGPKIITEPIETAAAQTNDNNNNNNSNPTPSTDNQGTSQQDDPVVTPEPDNGSSDDMTNDDYNNDYNSNEGDDSSNEGGSGGGGILDSITGLLGDFDIGSLLGGLGDLGGGGLGGLIDRNSIADKIEGAGNSAKDFFYGLADNVEENQGLDGIKDQIGDKINGIGGSGENSESGDSGDSGNPLDGLTDALGGIDLGGITDKLGGLGDVLGGLGGLIGG